MVKKLFKYIGEHYVKPMLDELTKHAMDEITMTGNRLYSEEDWVTRMKKDEEEYLVKSLSTVRDLSLTPEDKSFLKGIDKDRFMKIVDKMAVGVMIATYGETDSDKIQRKLGWIGALKQFDNIFDEKKQQAFNPLTGEPTQK